MNGPAHQEIPDGQRQRKAQRSRTERREKNLVQTLRRLVILELLTEDVTYQLERRATLRKLPLMEVIILYRHLSHECDRLTRAMTELASVDPSEVPSFIAYKLATESLKNLRRRAAKGGTDPE